MREVGDRIKTARDMKGMTQAELASHLGISRVSVTQWELNQTKPSSDKYSRIAEILGGSADWYLSGGGEMPVTDALWNSELVRSAISNDSPNAKVLGKIEGNGRMIPIYGQAVGGVDGEFEMNGNILYEVMAPPSLSGVHGAYGVSISGDSMYPRYEDGEIAFIDPKRRVKKGDYVVAQVRLEEHGPLLAFVKKFCRHNAAELVLEQFNPPKEIRFDAHCVVTVHYIALAGAA